ncbi:MAG TPA: AAA family ATPase, partial [Lachnospiraceae bacterium]
RKHPHQDFLQIDTTNILFICGGAFAGLEKIIESRKDKKSIGFNADIKKAEKSTLDEVLADVMPQDFVKFGLIPEFIGRVPVVVSLNALDQEALVRILTEPKNSLTKQYKKLFALDGVELKFDKEALEAVANQSLSRKTGARGLRAILEKSMLNLMYTIPSDDTICSCTITKEMIENKGEPLLEKKEETFKKEQKNTGKEEAVKKDA